MQLIFVLGLCLFHGKEVLGVESNSLVPRENCYSNEQPNCSVEFIKKYPEVSRSVTNLTEADTWFFLFTRKNPDQPELLHKCGGMLPPNSSFNANNTLMIIPNPFFVGICDIAAYREWKDQILCREDVNIIMIDYSWGSHLDERTSELNLYIVARQMYIVLTNVKNQTGLKDSQIHIIGHSLAAQLAGIFGNYIKVGYILALDPGGPGYAENKTRLCDRLDRNDADIVVAIHTNAGNCLPYIGLNYTVGDIDIYFNGGHYQEGCHKYGFISLLKGDFIYGIGLILISKYTFFGIPTLCSHAYVTEYFKVSINPGDCQFIGVQCDSYEKFQKGQCNCCGTEGERCIIVGYDTIKYIKEKPKDSLVYYVKTTLDCPYCQGPKNLCVKGFNSTYYSSLQNFQNSCSSEINLS